MIKQIRNVIDDSTAKTRILVHLIHLSFAKEFGPGDFAEASINNCQNVTQTGQNLEAVIDTNQTVVARIGLKVVFFHHINTRSGNSKTVAAAALNERAKIGAAALAAGVGLNSATAKRKLSLEASVLGHVVIQNLAPQEVLFKQCSRRLIH
jgi:hypothetical protein